MNELNEHMPMSANILSVLDESVKLLVVDDHPENLFVIEQVLDGMGCECIKATSGQEALSLLLKHDIALALLDVQMPDMSGFELAEFMRGKKQSRQIPIIFITALNKEPTQVFHGYQSGAVDYLFKPFDPYVLQCKVRVFIELHQQKRLLRKQAQQLEERMSELEDEVRRRQVVEQALRDHQNCLQELVAARTVELANINEQLCQKIVQHQRTEVELRAVMEGVIHAMALTSEIRDPYTAGHQRRVSTLAAAIAREMRMADDEIDGIRLAGLVHDLGKIYVPAEILSKPGHLNPIEFSLIKVHPQLGHDILQTIDFPWPIAQMVLQHQERLDGSGYPQGLQGEKILLGARIISVADVVEAMAFHRPYRPALGIEKAIEEITANQGRFYDATVVAACLSVLKSHHFTFENSTQ